ncbi:methyltransferase domain-containing protein [Marinospirillum sp.]|uniref:methyltransferase domain-containing protein n=1 Tax=Marinospirillum sp. TaxID=2183934 RepID=UPI0028703DC0|nr:methyltransferase domain-containing protein [Marinospirillum sp.]MDR9468719.1 methyltransferase domain-containing protein [Marinospirillum sp.]
MIAAAPEVRRSFDRGAARYRQLAQAQARMGTLLWQKCPQTADTVLDLGSGPGHWTARLAESYSDASVLGLDLSPAMVRQARYSYPEIGFVQGNAYSLPLQNNSLDLVFSNLALQWCPDLRPLLTGIHRVLKPGGRALITSLLPGSLEEIHQAWSQAGALSRVLNFQPEAAYQQAVTAAGFSHFHLEASPQVFYYPTSRDLLQSVTGIGASGGAGFLSKDQYRRIHQQLEQRRTPQGLPLTYQLLVMELIK